MKNPAAYYLFLLYMFALCKPVMPLIQDVIAHTFFEHQHIATVHQDGGKSHVDKEMGKMAEDENCNSNTLKSYDTPAPHIAVAFELLSIHRQVIALLYNIYYDASLFKALLAIQLLPP